MGIFVHLTPSSSFSLSDKSLTNLRTGTGSSLISVGADIIFLSLANMGC